MFEFSKIVTQKNKQYNKQKRKFQFHAKNSLSNFKSTKLQRRNAIGSKLNYTHLLLPDYIADGKFS